MKTRKRTAYRHESIGKNGNYLNMASIFVSTQFLPTLVFTCK